MLLYYITDRRRLPGSPDDQRRRILEKIAECVAAGVDYIQLREKDLSGRELYELAAEAMRLVSQGSRTRLLINSRVDIALACGAHGVHLPSDGLRASDARAIFEKAGRRDALVAVSTHTVEEVAEARKQGADFVVFGPVFEKSGQAAQEGLEKLRAACEKSKRMPVFALGGVTLENAQQCLAQGAVGIAGIRMFQESDALTFSQSGDS